MPHNNKHITSELYTNESESIADCFASYYAINEFFSPLFSRVGIHGFSFHRIFENEERVFLSNNLQWVECCFKEKYLFDQSYKSFINLPGYLLWVKWPEEDKLTHKMISDAYNNFNYANSLIINRKHKMHVDIFALRGFPIDNDVNYRYFTHLDEINRYLDIFLLKFDSLINKMSRFTINPVKCKTFSGVEATRIVKQQKELPNDYHIPISSNRILHPVTILPFLTLREEECIIGLILGKTSKEIGKDLSTSPRTIETHINNIKYKLGVTNKSKIISNILKVEYNKNIVFRLI